MRILMAGGGTAGHINPALAVANYIKGRCPLSEIAFVGTKEGLESTLVAKAGFDISFIDVRGFKRKLSTYNIGALKRVFTSYGEAKKIIKTFAPDIVIGTGGYVSGPVLFAASRLKIPTMIHEQNAFPGFTSRALARCVDKVLLSFEDSRKHFKCPDSKVEVVGNPIRQEMIREKKEESRAALSLDGRPFVVSFAGSLGAREINRAVLEFLDRLCATEKFQYLHATGERGWLWMPKSIEERGIDLSCHKNISVVDYIYDMPTVMSAADLVISRAGAITLSELAAMGKPSVLIPSPNVTNNHQYYNARSFAARGAAVVLDENKIYEGGLYEAIEALIDDPERMDVMGAAAQKLAVFDSAEKIYECAVKLL